MEVNLFPLPNLFLLPGARLTLNIFEPRYLKLIEDCVQHNRLMGVANAFKEDRDHMFPIPHESFPSIYPMIGFGKVKVLAKTKADTMIIINRGKGKGLIKNAELLPDGFIRAEVEELGFINQVDPSNIFLYRRILQLVEERAHEILNGQREVDVLLEHLQKPEEVVAFFNDHMLKDNEVKMQVFQSMDINDQIQLIGHHLTGQASPFPMQSRY